MCMSRSLMDYEYADSKYAAKEKGKEERSHPLMETIQRWRIVLQYERSFKNIPEASLTGIADRISMLTIGTVFKLILIKCLKSTKPGATFLGSWSRPRSIGGNPGFRWLSAVLRPGTS